MKKTVVSVATLTALAGTSVANIQAEEVTVKSGDTLWGIANAVGTTVADLKSANNLSSNLIHPGDVLSYSQSFTKNDANTYEVKAGDTLWAIGNQYGVSYSEIMKANNLKSDIIFPGQTLTLNVDIVEEVSAPEVAVESVETPVVETVEAVEETNTTGAYVIQSGDTLYKISRETGVDLNTLKSINSLKSDLIFPGQVLVLTGEVEAPVVEEVVEVEEKTEEVTETKVVEEVTETPEVEEVIEVVTEEAEVVEETPVVEEVSETTEDLATEKAEADKVAAEQAAAQKAEADRVAREQAAQKAEADKVAAEQAAAQKAEADRIAREQAAQKAEADRAAAEKAEQDRIAREQAAAEKAEADRLAAIKAEQNRIAAQKEQQRQAKIAAERKAAEQAAAPSTSSKTQSSYGVNYYYYGDCTWYAFERRKELGKGVSNMWGNGNNWADNARANGYNVNNTPSVGAIVHSYAGTNGAYSSGHVAVVESINPDGSITVSEMGWPTAGTKTMRTISADKVANHNFIH
ncbi:LysM peptidoglycan-binding domain-containing protein [Phocicoccus schoeneichii]|nr:LysM peptidoglycan-binding domain-containing protein [Jeotgalicoccus schoeneichii]